MFALISISVLLFALFIKLKLRKTPSKMDDFWETERTANLTRPKDISGLDYITVSFDSLSLSDHGDATLQSYLASLQSLEGKQMLNLSGQTNTELKLKYGSANLTKLSGFENNYIELVSMLHKAGARLYALDYITEAQAVLEYSVSCFTDVKKTYRLLAEIYQKQGAPDKIEALIQSISDTKVPNKEALQQELRSLL